MTILFVHSMYVEISQAVHIVLLSRIKSGCRFLSCTPAGRQQHQDEGRGDGTEGPNLNNGTKTVICG